MAGVVLNSDEAQWKVLGRINVLGAATSWRSARWLTAVSRRISATLETIWKERTGFVYLASDSEPVFGEIF